MELKDKVVVITGGSKGFGRALAEAFIKEGSKVAICSNDKNEVENTAKEIGAVGVCADVVKEEEIKSLLQESIKVFSKVDIWINNAGIQIAPSLIEDVDTKKLHNLFDINFFGYFYGCKTAIPYMKKQGSGVIVNINSTAGLEGKPEISAYSSSKFAIKGLTESIRKELKDSPIKIHGIFPGGMQTDIYKEKYPTDLKEYMEVNTVADKVIANLKSDTPEIDLIIKRPTV